MSYSETIKCSTTRNEECKACETLLSSPESSDGLGKADAANLLKTTAFSIMVS